jgi:hypothetical protein
MGSSWTDSALDEAAGALEFATEACRRLAAQHPSCVREVERDAEALREPRLVSTATRAVMRAEESARAGSLQASQVQTARDAVQQLAASNVTTQAARELPARLPVLEALIGQRSASEVPPGTRVLSLYIKDVRRSASEVTPADALRYFSSAPPDAFVCAPSEIEFHSSCGDPRRNTRCERRVPAGEPLLIIENDRVRGEARVVTVDGEIASVRPNELRADWPQRGPVYTLGPEALSVSDDSGRPLELVTERTGDIDWQPDFLRLLPAADPRRARFVEDQRRVSDCYDREMSKLDPNNRRTHYDIVKGDRVESLAHHLAERAGAACRVTAFETRRLRLQSEVLRPLQEARWTALRPVVRQLDGTLRGRSTRVSPTRPEATRHLDPKIAL